MKEKIVVICPGRGSYTKETLGYLQKYRPGIDGLLRELDERRRGTGQPTVSELDNDPAFKVNVHTKGENASILIHACAAGDFLAIDRDRYEIVAVTGNSMGWYITLALGGALDVNGAFDVINTMGSMMKDGVVGGQLIYPVVDDKWVFDPKRKAIVESIMKDVGGRPGVEVHDSIYLGGYLVIGGNPEGIRLLLKELPKIDDYPFQLINHAAFHTPLLRETSTKAFELLAPELFRAPKIPLIDGRGHIWQPYSTRVDQLYDYTLGHQVTEAYDFTAAITVALKEFMPDRIVLLGPGNSLGGSIGQIMIQNDWKDVKSKADFSALQKKDPFLLSMGIPEQAGKLLGPKGYSQKGVEGSF